MIYKCEDYLALLGCGILVPVDFGLPVWSWIYLLIPFFCACLKQDEKLKRVVEQHGEVWETVASFFEDRSDVQCQHRWTKVVNPQLVKGPWTKEVSTSFRLSLLSQSLYYPIASFV
jgi:hypothetical protein